MAPQPTTTIEVDATAAEIIRRASAPARSRGETLGTYLQHTLPAEIANGNGATSQAEAWSSFVAGMTSWAKSNLPAGYVADDSRESAYDDRN